MNELNEILRQYMKQVRPPSIQKFVAPRGGITVHNVLDTSKEPKPNGCNTFLEFWEKSVGAKADQCLALSSHICNDGNAADIKEIVGAHVRVDGLQCPLDEAWIVPLCKQCNNDDNCDPIVLPEFTELIPVRMSKKHATASDFYNRLRLALKKVSGVSK